MDSLPTQIHLAMMYGNGSNLRWPGGLLSSIAEQQEAGGSSAGPHSTTMGSQRGSSLVSLLGVHPHVVMRHIIECPHISCSHGAVRLATEHPHYVIDLYRSKSEPGFW